jgi:hypothetical protein
MLWIKKNDLKIAYQINITKYPQTNLNFIKMTIRQQINASIFGKLPLDIIQYVILPFHDYNVPTASIMKEHIEVYTRLKEREARLLEYNQEISELQFLMDPLQTDDNETDDDDNDVVENTFAEWIFETQRLHHLMKLEIFM